MGRAALDAGRYQALLVGGYGIASVEQTAGGFVVEVVLSPSDRNRLGRDGIELEIVRNADGLSASEAAAQQRRRGYRVWRPWDGPSGLEQQIRSVADEHPGIAELHTIGETHQGRDILAIRVTAGVSDVPLGERPAVLYQATAHAREWIATEVNRRLMLHYLENAATDQEIRNILATTELWFVPVMNPDGYQYTFDHERLWRKNLRDNNGDGATQVGDGVDPNRNYPAKRGIDEERVNVNGGAVAIGHPIGASGARILGALVHELRRRGGGYGCAAICSGGGQGDAIILRV